MKGHTVAKPRVAILSTWQEVCGIAHYTYFLKRALDPYLEIEVIPTPRQTLTKGSSAAEQRIADAYVQQVANRVAEFDHVNIQFEPGILANDMHRSSLRFKAMLSKAQSLSVTYHYLGRVERTTLRQHMAAWYQRHPMASIKSFVGEGVRKAAWDRVHGLIRSRAASGRGAAIVHTQRDARFLKALLPGTPVFDTPLTYIDDNFRSEIDDKLATSHLQQVVPAPRSDDVRYLGVFGFISQYKGLDTAIRALERLPENYELLMFSSIHESAFSPDRGENAELRRLMAMVEQSKVKSLKKRVHFLGGQSDDDLILAMMLCDACLFPYAETVHTASGPIAQALDLGRPVFASRNTQFTELAAYREAAFEFCDVGNYLEYAEKIPRMTAARTDRMIGNLRVVDYPAPFLSHTPDTTARVYIDALRASGIVVDLPATSHSRRPIGTAIAGV